VIRAVALAALVTGACTVDLGAPGAWTPVEEVHGALAPTEGAGPVAAMPPTAGATVRIVTFNILDGGIDAAQLAAAIAADPELGSASVIALQEEEAFPGEGAPRAQRLAEALGMSWAYVPARPERTGTYGNALLSRFPLSNVEMIDLPRASNRRQRIAMSADVQIGATTLRVVNMQLDTTLSFPNRIRQIRPAVLEQPDPVVVCGDFNTTSYVWEDGVVPLIPAAQVVDADQAVQLDGYMGGLGLVNETAGRGTTAAKFGITARLDAVFARGAVPIAGDVRRGLGLSDHDPVWVDIALP
jgi:endonuclease/exonuclease/phosphatase family metal-dependent hydrolase